MTVMHDASGCNSTYNTHDEPRWYDMDALVFISGLSELEAVLGDDEKLIEDTVRAAKELSPRFIALAGTPIPMITGCDLAAIAREIESRSGVPSFFVPSNGIGSYVSGAGQALRLYAERFVLPAHEKKKNAVNILGATPLDFSVNGQVQSIARRLTEGGFSVQSVWAMGSETAAIDRAGEAEVNLVVSSVGLPVAKFLRERFGMPYVVGAPLGDTVSALLLGALKKSIHTGENEILPAGTPDAPDTVILGESVTSRSLAAALLLLTGCAPAAQSPAPAETQQTAEPQAAAAEEPAAPEQSAEQQPEQSDTITVTDHNDNVVTVPRRIDRIVVCDILPLPSVLSVFFDSAEKLVGIAPSSMSAAQNSLLSQLYPEILNAETGFMNGTDVNTEELMKLAPDVVFYSAMNPTLGEKLQTAGFCAVAVSANKWEYDCIETLNNWIDLLSSIFPENDRAALCRQYSTEVYDMVQQRVKDIPDEDRARAFFLFQYNDSTIMTSGKLFFGQWWATAIGARNVAEELTQDNSVTVNLEQVYEWNPGVIFMTNFNTAQPEDLYNNTVGTYDWGGIQAVQDQRVYKMPLGMYRSYTPGIDTPITLLWMAKTVYPALFEDIDVTQRAIDYYQEVFGVTLTAEQVEQIFAPISAAGTLYF